MTKLKDKRYELTKNRAKLITQRKNLSNEVAVLDRTWATLESKREFLCVWIRNNYIKRRICTDFARRQKKLVSLSEHDGQKYDGSVEVFPVCAAAFTDLLKGKKPLYGFPSKLYTGISRLRQWLGEVVFVYREKHLDLVLCGLQRLYDNIRCWSDDNSSGTVHFSREEVEQYIEEVRTHINDTAPDILPPLRQHLPSNPLPHRSRVPQQDHHRDPRALPKTPRRSTRSSSAPCAAACTRSSPRR